MDLGELGAAENASITYDWKFHHSLPALTIWVVVALTVVSVKAHRNLRTLAVLAPLAILAFAWPVAADLLGMGGMNRQISGIMFYSTIAGVSMLWLLSGRLGRLKFLVRPIAALGILMLASLAGMVGYGLDGDLLVQLGIVEFMLLPALVISPTLASVLCFKRYGRLRYGLWLLATTFGTCLTAMALFGFVMLIGPMGGHSLSMDEVREMMSQMLIAGLSVSAFLYVIQLIFLLFTLSTAFYRERFCKCLGLRFAGVNEAVPSSPAQSEPSSSPQKENNLE